LIMHKMFSYGMVLVFRNAYEIFLFFRKSELLFEREKCQVNIISFLQTFYPVYPSNLLFKKTFFVYRNCEKSIGITEMPDKVC
jgi:hypothetical protein